MPPQRFDELGDEHRELHQPDCAGRLQRLGEALLQDTHALGAGEQEGDGEEALDDDVGPSFDARELESFVRRGELRGGVIRRDPAQTGQLVGGQGVSDKRVVSGADAYPAVPVEIGGGQVGEVPTREDHEVGGTQCGL